MHTLLTTEVQLHIHYIAMTSPRNVTHNKIKLKFNLCVVNYENITSINANLTESKHAQVFGGATTAGTSVLHKNYNSARYIHKYN